MTEKRPPHLVCADCGPIPDQSLYDIGGEQFHAVVTREARLYGYFGPEPEEAEPCGPVTVEKGSSTPGGAA